MKKIYAFIILAGLFLAFLLPTLVSTKKARTLSTNNIIISPVKSHAETIRAIDMASNYRMAADLSVKQGQLDDAAVGYKKAYDVDIGSRAVSGLKLAMTYEKLGRTKEGIALLDQMILNGELSSNGIKNANEIKSRLLAATAQAKQSLSTST